MPTFIAVLSGFFLLYLGSGIWLLYRGWPIRAGLAMAATTFFPIAFQLAFTDSDMPGLLFGFLFLQLFMLPLPLIVIVGGIVFNIARWHHQRADRLLHSS